MNENYSLPASATVATETHVPRAWYDAQRVALIRAEGRCVALIERVAQLHKQLEGRGSKRIDPEPMISQVKQAGAHPATGAKPVRERTPTREAKPAAPKPTRARLPVLDIEF